MISLCGTHACSKAMSRRLDIRPKISNPIQKPLCCGVHASQICVSPTSASQLCASPDHILGGASAGATRCATRSVNVLLVKRTQAVFVRESQYVHHVWFTGRFRQRPGSPPGPKPARCLLLFCRRVACCWCSVCTCVSPPFCTDMVPLARFPSPAMFAVHVSAKF